MMHLRTKQGQGSQNKDKDHKRTRLEREDKLEGERKGKGRVQQKIKKKKAIKLSTIESVTKKQQNQSYTINMKSTRKQTHPELLL